MIWTLLLALSALLLATAFRSIRLALVPHVAQPLLVMLGTLWAAGLVLIVFFAFYPGLDYATLAFVVAAIVLPMVLLHQTNFGPLFLPAQIAGALGLIMPLLIVSRWLRLL